jgi:hypothetical protein
MVAGPPFVTDDPEPVEYTHWEFYISSVDLFEHNNSSGTLPHLEVNYGLITDVQVHLLLPINYLTEVHQKLKYGYANSEVGIKYRFIHEDDCMPQVGIFPIIEIPTIRNKQFGGDKLQLYLPLWIQKTWHKFTTYGGGGYWFNPGIENKNWIYLGWLLQYRLNEKFSFGGEGFYHSAESDKDNDFIGVNLGGIINFSDNFHIICSAGHNVFSKGNVYMIYGGLLWTL